MDEQKNNPVEPAKPHEHVSRDVQDFQALTARYGRPALIALAVAVILVLGFSVVQNRRSAAEARVADALFQDMDPDAQLSLARSNPKAAVAPLALLNAGALFFDQAIYAEAVEAYEQFLQAYPDHEFAPLALRGKAASLEAQGMQEEALAAYAAINADYPQNFIAVEAMLGQARTLEALARFDDARIVYEDFIAANPDDAFGISQAEAGLLYLNRTARAAANPIPALAADAAEIIREEGPQAAWNEAEVVAVELQEAEEPAVNVE